MPRAARTVLTVDLGTSATKAALWRGTELCALARAPIGTSHPEPGRAEQDPHDWWYSVLRACADLLGTAPAEYEAVGAVGFSSVRETFALFDADLRPLTPGILWSDVRAESAARVARRSRRLPGDDRRRPHGRDARGQAGVGRGNLARSARRRPLGAATARLRARAAHRQRGDRRHARVTHRVVRAEWWLATGGTRDVPRATPARRGVRHRGRRDRARRRAHDATARRRRGRGRCRRPRVRGARYRRVRQRADGLVRHHRQRLGSARGPSVGAPHARVRVAWRALAASWSRSGCRLPAVPSRGSRR